MADKIHMNLVFVGHVDHGKSTTVGRLMFDSGNVDEQYDAYEDLLLDVIRGDQSQFLRSDEVDLAWDVVDPILRVWSTERDFIPTYPAGTWGPQETRRMFEREDQFWRHSLEPTDD